MTMDDKVIEKVMELTEKGELQWNHNGDRGFECRLKESQFKLLTVGNNLEFQVGEADPIPHPLLTDLWGLIHHSESKRRRDASKREWEKALDDLSDS